MGADGGLERHGGLRIEGNVLYGADREVGLWVAQQIPGYTFDPNGKALGILADGRLVAGVLYERFNGMGVEVAIAALPEAHWATRKTLSSLFSFAYQDLGAICITVLVPITNGKSVKLALKLGFEVQCRIRFAAHDGSSLIVLQQFADQCRWVRHGQTRRKQRTEAA
jgi:hypothetical protein